MMIVHHQGMRSPVAVQKQVLSHSVGETAALTFGLRSKMDPDEGDLRQQALEVMIPFKEPSPKPWFQRAIMRLNKLLLMPVVRKVSVEVTQADLERMKSIPKNAGNLMLAAHPDYDDPLVLLRVMQKAGKTPSVFMIASEVFKATPRLIRKVWDYLGGMPVVRGRPNREVIEHLSKTLAGGGWSMLFPEGGVYWSRQVHPMEAGGIRIAIEAALMAQKESEAKGTQPRPVFMTPTAHAYAHTNPREMMRKMRQQLTLLEKHPSGFGKEQRGSIPERLSRMERHILTQRAVRYHVDIPQWDTLSNYQQATRLKSALMESLESRYLGHIDTGFEKRRALKVRMKLYDEVIQTTPTPERMKAIKEDIRKTLDIMNLIPYNEDYAKRHDGPEAWGESLKRLSDMMNLSAQNFGRRKATVKVLPPVDIHPIARAYAALPSTRARQSFVFELTNRLQAQIQNGVDSLVSAS